MKSLYVILLLLIPFSVLGTQPRYYQNDILNFCKDKTQDREKIVNTIDDVFKNRLLKNSEFRTMLCREFDLDGESLKINENFARKCDDQLIDALVKAYSKNNNNCYPKEKPLRQYISEVDSTFYDNCLYLFQQEMQAHVDENVPKTRIDEIKDLFKLSKNTLKEFVIEVLGPDKTELLGKIEMMELDMTGNLYQTSSGINNNFTAIDLRGKIFTHDDFIFGTLAHEWGHLLYHHNPEYFQEELPELLALFPNQSSRNEAKRKDEISADIWSGMIINYALKKNKLGEGKSKEDFLRVYCQAYGADGSLEDHYDSNMEYLHPVHRAFYSWEKGYSMEESRF